MLTPIKAAEVAILIRDKVEFKVRNIIRDEDNFIMIKQFVKLP